MAAREHDYQPGDTIRGDGAEYLVQAVLGSGGMGAVYRVKDKNIGRLFVLKVLHRSLAHRRDLIERFEYEARALGHLSHPGIIEIFQLNRTRDEKQMPYYLMEVLTGESLADSLRRHGKLDLFTALGIATKLLHALDHAHERGIVHRDIKPDNVFLHRGTSSEPVVKLLDFGILKLVAAEENPGIFIGTPRYCAPEQLQAGPSIGPQADLYAVGVVLFQMLTGHLPFEGHGGGLAEMVRTLAVEAPPLTKHGTFPPALVTLVASALAKKPGDRPLDAFTFASELRRIRKDFAPDREDPHTHVTAEVLGEPGRGQKDPSQITLAHLAAPTSPDEDIGKLMDALRADGAGAGGRAGGEASGRAVEATPVVALTGLEHTDRAAAHVLSKTDLSPSPGKPEVRRDAVTALPRTEAGGGAPGSVRYVTKEAPLAVVQQTVPMARPKAPVHHYTEPMAGRPGRFAQPTSPDAQTPEPQAIDNPSPARSVRAPASASASSLRRATRKIERVVPLKALPVALGLGVVVLVGGMFVMREKGASPMSASEPSAIESTTTTSQAAPRPPAPEPPPPATLVPAKALPTLTTAAPGPTPTSTPTSNPTPTSTSAPTSTAGASGAGASPVVAASGPATPAKSIPRLAPPPPRPVAPAPAAPGAGKKVLLPSQVPFE